MISFKLLAPALRALQWWLQLSLMKENVTHYTLRGELNIQAKSSKSVSGSRLMKGSKGSNSISGSRSTRGMTATKKADGSTNDGPDYSMLEIGEEVLFWSTIRQVRAIKEGVFKSRELL